jgi:alkylhydroperoxidase/carboxymuconolactone decarboxylase family protein YurZ
LTEVTRKLASDNKHAVGPWDSSVLQILRQWDPEWAFVCQDMSTAPWNSGVLPRKFIELVGVAVNVACTNLNHAGTRRHIRAAIAAGATRDEILMIFKMASLLAIHSCSHGAPILIGEAQAAAAKRTSSRPIRMPTRDKLQDSGQWNAAWDHFVELDPIWTEKFMAAGLALYGSGIFTPKEIELLSIAFDASYTHMYAPGTRRHIKGALKVGASPEESMEVLKLCVAQGIEACNLGLPILAEELDHADQSGR